MNVSLTDQVSFMAFWLSFSRWFGVLFQLPLFDNVSVPGMIKILATFLISFAFFPSVQGTLVAEINMVGLEHAWLLIAFHTTTGLIIGFLVKTLMSLYVGAGSILTQQIGFASVSYFDPSQGQQVGPFERMIEWAMIIIVLSSGAFVPIVKGAFSAAVLLAGPLIFANLLMNLVFGIVARTVPQMNVLMVSFVVNIGIGLILFLGITEEFFHVSFDFYVKSLGEWFQFISN